LGRKWAFFKRFGSVSGVKYLSFGIFIQFCGSCQKLKLLTFKYKKYETISNGFTDVSAWLDRRAGIAA
jgi:hypothetical protein